MEVVFDYDPYRDVSKKWYFELKPGYFYFTDHEQHNYFGNGGWTLRAEAGANFWGPVIVWIDGGDVQKEGRAMGGLDKIDFKLATLTLGLKGFYKYNQYASFYLGAAPRLFMMLMQNDSPFVRGDDNAVGIGLGADAWIWIYPIPSCTNIFLDLLVNYSLKTLKIEPDEISSLDNDVNVGSLTGGLGFGVRF